MRKDSLSREIDSYKKLLKEKESEIFQLKSVINHIPGDVYWKNKEGVYIGINTTGSNSLRKMNLLWKTEDIIGKTDYELYDKETADLFRKNDLDVMRTGVEITKEEVANLPSGDKKIHLSTKQPLYDEGGNVNGIVGNTIDITYLKKIESQLIEQKEKAEEADLIKTEFIRNMEHDIRTPFSGIWGMANYLWEQETDPIKKEYLGDITQCAKELLDYCNGILDFSNVESGAYTIFDKKFDLESLINRVMKVEMPAAKHSDLLFRNEYDQNIPKILIGDPNRVYRILINLVSNSIKFTHTGSVELIVKLLEQRNKLILIRFIVKDTGIGIPTEKKDFIFEKFSRLSLSNKGAYKGIGLGLRVVKQFMHELEGEIDVVSDSKNGTQFICTVPFKQPLTNDFVDELF